MQKPGPDIVQTSCPDIKGGGFSPDFCKNTILRYELAMMARTCTNNLRVVFSPYVQHCRAFFGFWAQIFFGGLNQKSAMISMCKIHIYIDSESFRQIR